METTTLYSGFTLGTLVFTDYTSAVWRYSPNYWERVKKSIKVSHPLGGLIRQSCIYIHRYFINRKDR